MITQNKRLASKVAVVTGASKGIGAAIEAATSRPGNSLSSSCRRCAQDSNHFVATKGPH